MNYIAKGLPSFFTSLGLISGCISIVFSVAQGDLNMAGYFVLAAAVFDFIDGMVARSLKQITAFGKQLDSLADVVSFGVAPAMILYRLLLLSHVGSSPGADFDVMNPTVGESFLLYSAFLVAVFSALRLAKFNLDPEQVRNFKGLPTPANAVFISALGFTAESSREFPLASYTFDSFFLLIVIILSCYFLVSNIRMFSLKFSSFDIRKNHLRYVFLLLAAGLLLVFRLPGLAPVIVLYILMSLVNNWFVKME
jgi:CDP-diacylglycerol--serine O-phosphatidyltransferase